MKRHAIIPIFIPHLGCPNDCVFCNQRKITAQAKAPVPEDVHSTVASYMSTLENMDMDMIELSFFGGSFTGIPMEEQKAYLTIAKDYKDKGLIQKIHLSTRPDYIDRKILDNLKSYGVDVIELGVQSFAQSVLEASKRGHSASCVYESSRLIKEYGFELGLQLMIGLPGDTLEYDIFSAKEAVSIKPELARLYPAVLIKDTELYEMFQGGSYVPLAQQEAVHRTAIMYRILTEAGVNVIRVGLKASDIMGGENIEQSTFHPAFRQLVEGQIAREDLEKGLKAWLAGPTELAGSIELAGSTELAGPTEIAGSKNCANSTPCFTFISHPDSYNNMIGHKAENKKYFESTYPHLSISYRQDPLMAKGVYQVQCKGDNI